MEGMLKLSGSLLKGQLNLVLRIEVKYRPMIVAIVFLAIQVRSEFKNPTIKNLDLN